MTTQAEKREELEASSPLVLFAFSEAQLALLRHIQAVEFAKKLDVRFDSCKTEDDIQAIRRVCYLDGGTDMLKYLLDFDSTAIAQRETELRDRLSQQAGQQLPDQSTF